MYIEAAHGDCIQHSLTSLEWVSVTRVWEAAAAIPPSVKRLKKTRRVGDVTWWLSSRGVLKPY